MQLSVLKRMLKPRQYSKSPKFLPTYLIQGFFKKLFPDCNYVYITCADHTIASVFILNKSVLYYYRW